jgi:hypothetical protein
VFQNLLTVLLSCRLMTVLKLSWRWCFKSRSFGLWLSVALWWSTNVSKAHGDSTVWVGIAQSVHQLSTGWTIGWSVFYSRQVLGIFLFNIMSRRVLGPTKPPIQWVPGALSLGVKRPEREGDHSPPSSAEVK